MWVQQNHQHSLPRCMYVWQAACLICPCNVAPRRQLFPLLLQHADLIGVWQTPPNRGGGGHGGVYLLTWAQGGVKVARLQPAASFLTTVHHESLGVLRPGSRHLTAELLDDGRLLLHDARASIKHCSRSDRPLSAAAAAATAVAVGAGCVTCTAPARTRGAPLSRAMQCQRTMRCVKCVRCALLHQCHTRHMLCAEWCAGAAYTPVSVTQAGVASLPLTLPARFCCMCCRSLIHSSDARPSSGFAYELMRFMSTSVVKQVVHVCCGDSAAVPCVSGVGDDGHKLNCTYTTRPPPCPCVSLCCWNSHSNDVLMPIHLPTIDRRITSCHWRQSSHTIPCCCRCVLCRAVQTRSTRRHRRAAGSCADAPQPVLHTLCRVPSCPLRGSPSRRHPLAGLWKGLLLPPIGSGCVLFSLVYDFTGPSARILARVLTG
jgi:hypothetical protein